MAPFAPGLVRSPRTDAYPCVGSRRARFERASASSPAAKAPRPDVDLLLDREIRHGGRVADVAEHRVAEAGEPGEGEEPRGRTRSCVLTMLRSDVGQRRASSRGSPVIAASAVTSRLGRLRRGRSRAPSSSTGTGGGRRTPSAHGVETEPLDEDPAREVRVRGGPVARGRARGGSSWSSGTHVRGRRRRGHPGASPPPGDGHGASRASQVVSYRDVRGWRRTSKVRTSASRPSVARGRAVASTRIRCEPTDRAGSGTSAAANAAAVTVTGAIGSVSDRTVNVTAVAVAARRRRPDPDDGLVRDEVRRRRSSRRRRTGARPGGAARPTRRRAARRRRPR